MKTKELIKLLSKLDQEAFVYIEYEGEHRGVNSTDVVECDGVYDQDAGEVKEGKFVTFTSWS